MCLGNCHKDENSSKLRLRCLIMYTHIKGGGLGWLTNKYAKNSLSYVKCSLLGLFKVTVLLIGTFSFPKKLRSQNDVVSCFVIYNSVVSTPHKQRKIKFSSLNVIRYQLKMTMKSNICWISSQIFTRVVMRSAFVLTRGLERPLIKLQISLKYFLAVVRRS